MSGANEWFNVRTIKIVIKIYQVVFQIAHKEKPIENKEFKLEILKTGFTRLKTIITGGPGQGRGILVIITLYRLLFPEDFIT